jgi:hypothetical protein
LFSWGRLSWAGEDDFLADFLFLIVAGVGTRLPGERNAEAAGMDEIAVAALPTPVDEAGSFEVGHQLAELPGHDSIKMILWRTASAKSPGAPEKSRAAAVENVT